MKIFLALLGVGVVLVGGFFALNSDTNNSEQFGAQDERQSNSQRDRGSRAAGYYQDAEFLIEGERMKIGESLRYFGNDLVADINGDGEDDIVFIVMHEPGGSGTFYYVVAAMNTGDGYIGSDGYLLGDRIAPQTTEMSRNPRHVDVVAVNYVDHAPGEPMTAQPSVHTSVYLKIDSSGQRWGIVEPDFEGESA